MIKKISEKLNNENSNINKSMPLFIIFLFIILNITIIFNLYSKENEKKDLLRLHVVANSNSLDDQITKLKVYENIEKYLNNTVTSNVSNTSDIKEIISNDFENILEISNNILKENKKNYSSTVTDILTRCQISSTYSWIVRSEENLPACAVFRIAFFAQPFSSAYIWEIRSCAAA